MDFKKLDPQKVLASSLVALLIVFAIPGMLFIAKSANLAPAGLLGSFDNIFGGSGKVSKIGSGRVVSINGNTITLQGTINTTYKVDASSIKMTKGIGQDAQNISVSDIKQGDMVQVYGTVSGNPVSVSSLVYGGTSNNPFTFSGLGGLGNLAGHPSVSGTVSAVNGSSFTVDKKTLGSNPTTTSYTVNTDSSTVFTKDGKKASLSDVATGQKLSVSGTIDENSKTITATNINIGNPPSVTSGNMPNFANILKGIETKK